MPEFPLSQHPQIPPEGERGKHAPTGLNWERRRAWSAVSQDGEFATDVALVGDHCLWIRSSGSARSGDINMRRELVDRVRASLRPVRVRAYLLDFTGLRRATLGARRTYMRWISAIVAEDVEVIAFGMGRAVRALVRLGRAVDARFSRIQFAPDLDAALRALVGERQSTVPATPTEPHVEQLMRHLGRLTLREDLEQSLPQLPEDDPYAPVFDALGAVQADIRELLDTRATRARELRALIEGIQAGILLEDGKGRIAVANQHLCDMFELAERAELLIGRRAAYSWAIALPRFEDPEAARRLTAGTTERAEPVLGTLLRLTDGRSIERDYIPIPMDEGQFNHLWIYRDVTEREEAAAELARARDAALAASRAKSEFLATMSHEIRTPLNAIMGMTEMLARSDLGERDQRLARVANEGAEVLLTIVNEILDLSHLESGTLMLRPAPFNLHALLHELVSLFGERAEQKGIALRHAWPASLPVWVVGDVVRVRHVLMNLLGNALKFTHVGHVRLSASAPPRSRAVGTTEEVVRVRFEVEDSGIGFDDTKIARLFEPFTQADQSSTREYEGTGLGLAICKRLIDLMQGHVEGSSQIGEGSTFVVEIPFELADEPSEQPS